MIPEELTVLMKYTIRQRKKRSLNACLVALGANPKDVYKTPDSGNRCAGRSCETIYDRLGLSRIEILKWAEHLRKRFMWEFHPDRNRGCKDCEDRCKSANEAFVQIVHILEHRK